MAVALSFGATTSGTTGAGTGAVTLSNVAIGTAAADRIVIAVFTTQSDQTHSSVTIGGVTATLRHSHVDAAATPDLRVSVWTAPVPTGTTANIDFTLSAAAAIVVGCSTIAMTGGSPIPSDTDQAAGSAATISISGVTILTDGGAVYGFVNDTNNTAVTWTNATEVSDANYNPHRHSAATRTTAGTVTTTADGATAAQALIGVAFPPASTGTAAGTGAASGQAGAAGSAAGTGTADGQAGSSGSASGVGTATAEGESVSGATEATGTAAGVGSANGYSPVASNAVVTRFGAPVFDRGGDVIYAREVVVAAADGTATGTGTASGVGETVTETVGTAAGTGAASGDGTGVLDGVGSAAGVGAASGLSTTDAVGTAAGTGAASGVAPIDAVGTAAGVGAAQGRSPLDDNAIVDRFGEPVLDRGGDFIYTRVQPEVFESTGTAAGTGAASAVGTAIAEAVGSAAGTGAADGAAGSAGTATGTGAADGAAGSAGTAVGTGAASGQAGSAGTAAGIGTASGAAGSAGSSAGVGAANGAAGSAGTASGTGAASGVAPIDAVGTAAGIGAADGQAGSAGTAAGTGATDGRATTDAVGTAAGTGAATANGQAVWYLPPDADVSDGNWTNELDGSELFSSIDEAVANDADYIKSGENPTDDVARLRVTNPAVSFGSPVRMLYRYKKDGSGTINLAVRLYQGAALIAEWTHNDISDTAVTAEQTLTTEQVEAITNPDELFFEFEADAA